MARFLGLAASVAYLAGILTTFAPAVAASIAKTPAAAGPFVAGDRGATDPAQVGAKPPRWQSFSSGMPADSLLVDIVAGPYGNFLWYTNSTYGMLGRMSLNGSTTVFPLHTPSGQFMPGYITVGADRKLYMGGCVGVNCGLIGRMGGRVFTAFPTASGDGPGQFGRLALGPDGNVWFSGRSHIGKIVSVCSVPS
jgi:streptogramin lyase